MANDFIDEVLTREGATREAEGLRRQALKARLRAAEATAKGDEDLAQKRSYDEYAIEQVRGQIHLRLGDS